MGDARRKVSGRVGSDACGPAQAQDRHKDKEADPDAFKRGWEGDGQLLLSLLDSYLGLTRLPQALLIPASLLQRPCDSIAKAGHPADACSSAPAHRGPGLRRSRHPPSYDWKSARSLIGSSLARATIMRAPKTSATVHMNSHRKLNT
jgi:hypothetical protein